MTNSSIHVDVNKFLKLLPRYQCHKQVNALQISGIFPNPRGVELHFADATVIPFQMSNEWFAHHCPHVGGYLVAYDNGYLSFSPADVFHAGYSRMDEVDTDEDLLERRFWQFDAARKESGDERYVFKGFMRAYAGGVTNHTVGDVGVAHSNPAEAPQFAWSSQAALDVVAKRRYLIEYEGIDYGVEDDLSSGELAEAADCYLRYFGNATPKYWPLGESLWKPSARRENLVTAAALIIAEIERRDRAGYVPSVDALEIAAVEDIAMRGDSSAVPVVMDGIIHALPPKIICYTAHDLVRRSSVLAEFGNFNASIPENLATLYSECLAIAATENLELLQLMHFLDVGVRALFRVKQIQDCAFSSLNA